MSDAPAPRTAREMLARGREFLERSRVEEARLDAELLVAHALGLDRLRLFLELDRPVDPAEIDRARELLVRRAGGEPTAYLTGVREFYGHTFRVGPGVLIPRPETELLVDVARERLADRPAPLVGEVGCGSGCIAITLALAFPEARVHATKLSEEALVWARENAERLEAPVHLHHGDGLGPLAEHAPFDLLLSNPPYVDPEASGELAREIRDHEPDVALYAPRGDPDHWLGRLVDEGLPLLGSGGTLLVELGFDQAPRARKLLDERAGTVRFHADLAGVERVAEVTAAG